MAVVRPSGCCYNVRLASVVGSLAPLRSRTRSLDIRTNLVDNKANQGYEQRSGFAERTPTTKMGNKARLRPAYRSEGH